MTGGLAYILDSSWPEKLNPEIVKIQRVATAVGAEQLKSLIESHVERTNSPKGKLILANWDSYLGQFWQAAPSSEADSPEAQISAEKTLTSV
jgi:glutamate synthase (ferredoxin)